MKFMAEATQRLPRIEVFQILESGVTATASDSQTPTNMPEGFTRGSVSEAANNVYTLTFTQPFSRAPTCSVTPLHSTTGTSIIAKIKSVSTTALVFNTEDDAGSAAAPESFHIIVVGFDSADVI